MQTLRGEVFLHVFVTKSEVLGKLNSKRANMIKQLTRLYVNDPNEARNEGQSDSSRRVSIV